MRHIQWVRIGSFGFVSRRHVFANESSADYLKIPKTEKLEQPLPAAVSQFRIFSNIPTLRSGIPRLHLVRVPRTAATYHWCFNSHPHSVVGGRAKNMKLKINLTFLRATLVGLLSIILLTQTAHIEAFGSGGSSSGNGAVVLCKELSKCLGMPLNIF